MGIDGLDELKAHGSISVNAEATDWWQAIGDHGFIGFVDFLSRTKVWLGFLLGLGLVGLTIWLRRRQGDNL